MSESKLPKLLPDDAQHRDRAKEMRNKVERLQLDLGYKTEAYISAYSVLSKVRRLCDESTFNTAGLTIPEIQRTLSEWNKKDEEFYQVWNTKRKEVKRSQRRKPGKK